ncbi:MAG: sulfatase-like hydrolase/transferase [Actinomycetota bacterium]|nr:sulfatase-like hydrolase/transferase [Actinomycetota bacterium]
MSLKRLGSVSWWTVPLSLATVAAFAFGQPFLDLLGKNPNFFIARGLTSLDVILFPVVVLLLPVVLAMPVLVLRWVGPRTAGLAHAVLMGALFALLTASAWIALLGSDWSLAWFAVATLGAGALFAVAFTRYQLVRTAVGYASWALLAFAAWFLLIAPSSDIAFTSLGDLPEIEEVTNPVPIVMLVFDEFPVATMIDSKGALLEDIFPSFSELAADGVWYRNGVGVRQQTDEALPTILSGVGAALGSVAISSNHPLNLFTLLSDAYDIAAMETVTSLCPDFACANSSRHIDPLSQRWGALAVDLSVVYGHLTMPRAISDQLPAIDQTWGNFTTGDSAELDIIDRFLSISDDDRREEVDRFLATLEFDRDEPSLRFGHFLYPHHPWVLTADGQPTGVTSSPGSEGNGWGLDRWLVGQGYQRHILQAQYADTILGQVMDRMKEELIYDEALLVVVGDHGIAISPGVEHQRIVTPDTVGAIAAVPMFIKYPSRFTAVEPGTIDDIRAETVDLLPTVADVVGVTVPWDVDGFSMLDPGRASRAESAMLGKQGEVRFGVDGAEKLATAAEKETWFSMGDPWSLTPAGWEAWPGRSIAGLAALDAPEVTITVNQQGSLDALSDELEVLPVFLSGRITLDESATGREILVVAVDGVVQAVTRTFEPKNQSARFHVLIPPDLLHPGKNDVVVWLADGSPRTTSLRR